MKKNTNSNKPEENGIYAGTSDRIIDDVVKGKRDYKDSLFCFIFGSEEYKHFSLALYNAVNGSDYTDVNDVTINTLKDVLFINVRNDISFVLKDVMNLYEHQSTFNPNIPVRMFIYSCKLINKYIHDNQLDIYSSTQLELPTPKLLCFYNGIANKEDVSYLRLSDSFKKNIGKTDGGSDIEVTVKMININNGRNEKLLNSCRPLKDYAMFVEQVRKYGAIYDADAEIESEKLADAINNAIDSLPEDSEIKAILESRRAEVVKLCIEEYTKEHSDYVRKIEDDRKNEKISQLEKDNGQLKEESERKDKIIAEKDKQFEKLKEDKEIKDKQLETAVNGFVRLAKDGKLSVPEAAKYAGMSTEEFEKLM